MQFTPALFKGRKREPYGEFTFYSGSTQGSWVVPEGVTSIAVICVSPGQRAATGYGGGVRYKNDIAVTPGDTYSAAFSTGSSPSSAFRKVSTGVTICSAVGQNSGVGTGTSGASGNGGASFPRAGGGAGGMLLDGRAFNTGSSNVKGGGGMNPFIGNAPPGQNGTGLGNSIGADFGGGTGIDSNSATGASAGRGCIRIIYGKVDGVNRAFPNTGVEPIPYRSYPEWLAHITQRTPLVVSAGGSAGFWPIGQEATQLLRVQGLTTPGGSMTGSAWSSRGLDITASSTHRIVQHSLLSLEVYTAIVAAGGEVLLGWQYSDDAQNYLSINRNNYTSLAATKEPDTAIVVTECSYWNPLTGGPETTMPWAASGPLNYLAEGW